MVSYAYAFAPNPDPYTPFQFPFPSSEIKSGMCAQINKIKKARKEVRRERPERPTSRVCAGKVVENAEEMLRCRVRMLGKNSGATREM
jgi:hypothetical protein